MTEPSETPTKPWVKYTVIGIVVFVAVITFIGIYKIDARPYIETASKWMLGAITSIKVF